MKKRDTDKILKIGPNVERLWLNPGSRGRTTRPNCDEAGDYFVPNVLSPRDLVSRPDNMNKTVLSSSKKGLFLGKG